MKFSIIEYITEREVSSWFRVSYIPDIQWKSGGKIIIFFSHPAEMNRFFLFDAKIIKHIHYIVKYVRYVTVSKRITKLQIIIIENKKIKKISLNMSMNIVSVNTFSY